MAEPAVGGAGRVGTILTLPGAAWAELVSEPLDLVWIDIEHGALAFDAVVDVLVGAQATGTHALVRLPSDEPRWIKVMLDAGVDGIVIADVRARATVDEVRRVMTHQPEGARGWGPRRLGTRHRGRDVRALRPELWVQIESAEGVAGVDEILGEGGVDALVVGTADLSFNLGVPLQADSPLVLDAIATVRDACRRHEVTFGLAGDIDAFDPAVTSGADLLMHGTDARLLAAAVDQAAARARTRLSAGRPRG